ncbi:MAG TPA: laccase domain-containing protein [Candidatus Paceibacterota bacterium]|nr:laccase domain-containing protein [Candidatus Paceibacterota bacterium]
MRIRTSTRTSEVLMSKHVNPRMQGVTYNLLHNGVSLTYYGGEGLILPSDFHDNMAAHESVLRQITKNHRITQAVVPDFRGATRRATLEKDLRPFGPSSTFFGTSPTDAVVTDLPVISITADCHTLVVKNARNGMRAVVHGSRDAQHPIARDGKTKSGNTNVFEALNPALFGSETYAFIACGIGSSHFDNRTDYDEFHGSLIRYLVRKWGGDIVDGGIEMGRLNVPLLLRRQLEARGVPGDNIAWDGIDTYTDPRFNSRRAGSKASNCLVIEW